MSEKAIFAVYKSKRINKVTIMRLFDSSLINQLILSALKDKSLQHYEIVDTLSEELDLTQEEREEKEGSTNTGVFYHKVAGLEQSLKNQGLIVRNGETKKWEILEEGKCKLLNDMSIVNNDSIFHFFCKKSKTTPQKIKKEDSKKINYLSYDKDTKELFVIDINPIINDKQSPIIQLQDKINFVKISYPSKTVRGILIIKKEYSDKIILPKNSHNVEILCYDLDLKISRSQQIEYDDEILPSNENAFSNYIKDHFQVFKDVNMDFHIDNSLRPREYHVYGRRSIDVLCRDNDNSLVVIENKINTNTEYHVVGQILYYLYHMEHKYSQDKIRGIILIPNKNKKEKTQTIVEALRNRRSDLNIDLLFYSLSCEFL